MSDDRSLKNGGLVRASYICGCCKRNIAKPGGRKRQGTKWVCPECIVDKGLNK